MEFLGFIPMVWKRISMKKKLSYVISHKTSKVSPLSDTDVLYPLTAKSTVQFGWWTIVGCHFDAVYTEWKGLN